MSSEIFSFEKVRGTIRLHHTLTIIFSVLIMALLQPVSALSHVDTTYDDFFDDGAAARFQDTLVVGGAVELELVETNWVQGNWSKGPGQTIWNDQDGFTTGDGMEYNTTEEISLWGRYGDWEQGDYTMAGGIGLAVIWTGDRFITTGGMGSVGTIDLTLEYFIETDTWNKLADLPADRFNHAMAFNGSDVFVLGDGTDMDSVLRYNRTMNSWTALPDAPINRTMHTVVHSGDNTLLVFGGKNETGASVSELWSYNISTGAWVKLKSAPRAMFGHAAIWDDVNGQMIVTGGKSGSEFLWHTYTYDPGTDTWAELAHMPESLVDHTMVWAPEHEMIFVFGGEGDGYEDSIYFYSLDTDEWSLAVHRPSGRSGHTAAWATGQAKMGVFGGLGDAGYNNETWLYTFFENRTTGWFTSSQVDLGKNVDFKDIDWTATVANGTDIEFQLASNNDHQTWDYLGPDGTGNTRFNGTSKEIPGIHDGNRYFRYKAFMSTENGTKTPVLGSVTVEYRYHENPGWFTSRVFDLLEDGPEVTKVDWDSNEPNGTSIKLLVDSSPNPDMSDPVLVNWTVTKGEGITEDLGQYLRYRAKLVTLNASVTPVLEEVRIEFSTDAALSDNHLEPLIGTEEVMFEFSVVYTDVAGRAPQLAQVVIDSSTYDMTTPDLDPSDGAIYNFSTKLPVGTHEHHFNFRVGGVNLRLPTTGTFNGPKVIASNEVPIPVITLPKEGTRYEVGETIVLRGDQSYDPDGDDLTFEWASNISGFIASEANFNVTLAKGLHVISLKVDDGRGAWSMIAVNITVVTAAQNRPPVPIITEGDFVKVVGDEVLVDASHSYDPDGSIINWTFEWGDGDVDEQAGGVATHTYTLAGTYTAKVTVMDNNGRTNSTTFQIILKASGGPPPPEPKQNYTTSGDEPLMILIPVMILLIVIVIAFVIARRSKY